jgi:hypothetical protein
MESLKENDFLNMKDDSRPSGKLSSRVARFSLVQINKAVKYIPK